MCMILISHSLWLLSACPKKEILSRIYPTKNLIFSSVLKFGSENCGVKLFESNFLFMILYTTVIMKFPEESNKRQ